MDFEVLSKIFVYISFIWYHIFLLSSEVLSTIFIMSPHHGERGGGHIVFSADPVDVASCPHSISLLNGHILAKLTQIYHWEEKKC